MSIRKSITMFVAGSIFTGSLSLNIGYVLAQANGQSVTAPVSAAEQSNVLVNAAAALSSTNGVIGGQGSGANNQGAGASNAVNSTVSNTSTQTISRDYNNYQGATVQNQASEVKQIVKSTVPVNAAPLTTSGLDTCLGSVSGGVSVPGVAVTGGKTVVDKNCVMLKNSKRLQELGLKDAAVALMIQMDSEIAEALKVANPEIYDAFTNKAKIVERAKSVGVNYDYKEFDSKSSVSSPVHGD